MLRIAVRSTCVLAVLVVLVGSTPRPAEAGIGTSPSGVYHGFFQSRVTPGLWGLVEFVITDVHNRRWTGVVTMIIPAGSSQVRLPFVVDGTIASDDNLAQDAGTFDQELGHDLGLGHGAATFNGVGQGFASSFVEIHGRIDFLDGGAALTDARYRFRPPDAPGAASPAEPDEGTSTLLRGFVVDPDMPPPNVSGNWDGVYTSDAGGGNGTFALDVTQSCEVPPPTTDSLPTLGQGFTGIETIDGNAGNPYYFFGHTSGSHHLVVAGWNPTGDRFLVTGNYNPPPDPDKRASGTASYLLLLANGTSDHGKLTFVQQLLPPDPCRQINEPQ
jgi:hypothetical protein